MFNKFVVITLITFIIFFIEALLHFNIGKNGNDYGNEYVKFHIPEFHEFIKIGIIVLIFSSLSGVVSSYIIKYHLY